MTSAFATARDAYTQQSSDLSDVAGSMVYPSGSGQFVNALTERIAQYQTQIAGLSDAATQIASVSDDQAHADTVFAAHPNRDDLRAQEQVYKQAQESGDRAWEVSERDKTDELRQTCAAKRAAHAGESGDNAPALRGVDVPNGDFSGTGVHTPRSAGGEGPDAHPSNPLPGTVGDTTSASTDDGSSGGDTPSLSDTDAGTALSADTGTPSLYAGPAQPSLSPMTPQQLGGQPAPSAGSPVAGGVPSAAQNAGTPTSRTRGAQLSTDTSRAARDAERARRARERNRDNTPRDGDTTAVVAPIDRGSSNNNVTTTRDTSGNVKTALSGSTVPQGTGNGVASTNPARGPMGPMGGVGGMGAGAQLSNAKSKPDVLSHDGGQVGYDKDGIQGGTISRESSDAPTLDEYRAERETGHTKDTGR